jgi:hypothetical protein
LTNFNCPACGRLVAAEVPPGTQVQCPLCRQIVLVPGSNAALPPTANTPIQLETPPPGASAAQDFPTSTAYQPAAGLGLAPIGYARHTAGPPAEGLATGALVCGIIGLVGSCVGFGAIVGLVGLILGIVALVKISGNPAEYGGKGKAIGGICTGALSIVMVPILIAALMPALSSAREQAKRTVCSANLRGIGQALYIYAQSERDGAFPEKGADWMARLTSNGNTTSRQFICPSTIATGGTTYHYVPGYTTNSKPTQILVYEDPAAHQGEGGTVLYQDGHVPWLPLAQPRKEIAAIRLPNGSPYTPADGEPAEDSDDTEDE